ncbi:hypothetical protein C8R45DRAFT_1069055 [Mycena sanguinolenta]|nr:hypothetical protein C8R45DRAFT_1069055 [Mycena sanguinolenta]
MIALRFPMLLVIFLLALHQYLKTTPPRFGLAAFNDSTCYYYMVTPSKSRKSTGPSTAMTYWGKRHRRQELARHSTRFSAIQDGTAESTVRKSTLTCIGIKRNGLLWKELASNSEQWKCRSRNDDALRMARLDSVIAWN